MKHKTVATTLTFTAFLLTCLMVGCQTMHPQSTSSPVPSKEAVAAHEAYVARVRAAKALRDNLQGDAHQT
jgi:outer membrane PBP1 activator LpoA protein